MRKDKNSNKEISGRLEKKLAKKLGGRTTIGSGCLFFDQGDIKFQDFMIEHKFTKKDSYSLTDKLLKKNEQEAYINIKRPLFVVEFINEYEKVLKTYVIQRDSNSDKEYPIVIRYNFSPALDKEDYFTIKSTNKSYKICSMEVFLEELEEN